MSLQNLIDDQPQIDTIDDALDFVLVILAGIYAAIPLNSKDHRKQLSDLACAACILKDIRAQHMRGEIKL